VDRRVAPPPLLRRSPRRGARGARRSRPHRRLHARQIARRGARRRYLPRTSLPEPVRRPQARPHPLRGARTDGGRIMDDGTVARLDDEQFYVTTTSTGAEAVLEWFEWWNAVWHLDVEVTDVTGALAAINVAGPHARTLLGRLTD